MSNPHHNKHTERETEEWISEHFTFSRLLLAHSFLSRMKIDIHFSLIAAAVTYIMWQSVGEDKIKKMEGKKLEDEDSMKKRKGYWRVDCQSASKGGQTVEL